MEFKAPSQNAAIGVIGPWIWPAIGRFIGKKWIENTWPGPFNFLYENAKNNFWDGYALVGNELAKQNIEAAQALAARAEVPPMWFRDP